MKRWLLAALLGLLALPLAAQGLHQSAYYLNTYAQDSFAYANGSLTGNSNWLTQPSLVSLNVVSNQLECTSIGSTDCGNMYNVAFPSDQCAQSTILTLNAVDTATMEIKVRLSLTADTYYAAFIKGPLGSSAQVLIGKVVAGTFTSLVAFTSETINSGDIVTFCAQGTHLYTSIRGNIIAGLSTTDSSIASGVPGIGIQSDGQAATDVILGEWTGFYVGTTVPSSSGGATQVKFHAGQYAASACITVLSNTNGCNAEKVTEIGIVRAGPSQVLGYQAFYSWASLENSSAGSYTFTDLDTDYENITGYVSGTVCGSGVYSSPRRLGIYPYATDYFHPSPTTGFIPAYITGNPGTYGPGADGTHGGYWVGQGASGITSSARAALWRSAANSGYPVMDRWIALMQAIASHVLPDGCTVDQSPYVEAIWSPEETAALSVGSPDSTYTESNVISAMTALQSALVVAFPHTMAIIPNNFTFSQSDTQTLNAGLSGVKLGEGEPDVFTGTNNGGITWGQLAYIGEGWNGSSWVPGAGTNQIGVVPQVTMVQSTELGYNYYQTPASTFTVANGTIKASEIWWTEVAAGTFPCVGCAASSAGQNQGNWFGSCANQTAWTASPSSCGGTLFTIVNSSVSQTTCPTIYIRGCNTTMILPADNDDHFHELLNGRLREAA